MYGLVPKARGVPSGRARRGPRLIMCSPVTSICAVESDEGIGGEDGESERPASPDAAVGVEDDGEQFQYHAGAGDLDLAGEATDRNWSIRCVDVVKRLAAYRCSTA